MLKDLRETPLYREAAELYQALWRPGTGQVGDAAEIHVSPDGKHAVFSGTLMDKLEGAASTRICRVNLSSGQLQVLTFGPNTDRWPKFSPDGRQIAFLSDRHRGGDFQLHLLDSPTGAVRAASRVAGWIEYLHWSPDGQRILLGVAGHGADVSGGQGAVSTAKRAEATPSWMPTVDVKDESYRWRSVWVYELATDTAHQVSSATSNVWEAVWCGNQALAAVVSSGPGEGLWFSACLQRINLAGGEAHEIYIPRDQLAWPAASPSGQRLAVVEAVCSDRGLVAGDLRLIDTITGTVRHINTHGVDVSCAEWRSEHRLLLAGHRGFETVVGVYDVISDSFVETWTSGEVSAVGRYACVSGLTDDGDCAFVGEGFVRAPEIAVVRGGRYITVKSFDVDRAHQTKWVGAVEAISWKAPDGLDIQGWLLRPKSTDQKNTAHPLVMWVHGGPVFHHRSRWLGRAGGHLLLLLKHGYAVFLPNPRGSSGQGQDFVRRVVGDVGGADTYDLLSGLDHLVARGIADSKRLGVTGGSYGGYMSSWLITQDGRFAAAVSVVPSTNRVSQRLLCNHPHFVDLFVGDRYNNPGGKFFQRSPVMHAHKAKTPTLNICGALDRCTPPQEAMQFHNALLENGVRSVLVTYPQEGHGVRNFPAAIDYAARVVEWFETHMPAQMRS